MKAEFIIIILVILILGSCNSGYQKENNKWVWVSYDESVGKRVSQIDEHDVKSFKILRNRNYAIDDNSVFYIGRIIKDADPHSFELIKENDYSKDDENVFCGTIPLNINKNEVQEFQVTNDDELMSGMKSSTLLYYFIERNPEYEWLDTLGINGVIVGEWATGKTNSRKFKGFIELKE